MKTYKVMQSVADWFYSVGRWIELNYVVPHETNQEAVDRIVAFHGGPPDRDDFWDGDFDEPDRRQEVRDARYALNNPDALELETQAYEEDRDEAPAPEGWHEPSGCDNDPEGGFSGR